MASIFLNFSAAPARAASWLVTAHKVAKAALAAVAMSVLLGGCAHHASPPPAVETLLRDDLYPGLSDPADRASVLAMSPAMLAYVDTRLSSQAARSEPRQSLLKALYKQGDLRLSYVSGNTRNAAQAFEARAGNCMSLTLMTAAFARHLGLPVSFQSVLVDKVYTRNADMVMVSGHVNLVLGARNRLAAFNGDPSADWVVDFLPGADLRGQRAVPLTEDTVISMYFNNRAAEALADGQRGLAYAWARMAVRSDPRYTPAVNTLAVLYLRDGHMAAAQAALDHVLAHDASSTSALSNLALLLQRTGRIAQAETVLQRLARLQPDEDLARFMQGGKLARLKAVQAY